VRSARVAAAIVLLAISGVSGCATTQGWRRHTFCAIDDTRPWTMSAAPPTNAAELSALADAHPNYPNAGRPRQTDTWFSLPTGEIMLCRTDGPLMKSYCDGEWWQFREDDGVFVITSPPNAWVCVS